LLTGPGGQCLDLFVQIVHLSREGVDGVELCFILALQVLALGRKAIGTIEIINLKLGPERYQLAVLGLRDLVTVDTSYGQTWDDDIEINPEANNSPDDEQNNQTYGSPGSAALNLDLFVVGKVFSPAKNKRLAVAPHFDVRCLLMILLRFIRSCWSLIIGPSYRTLSLIFHITPLLLKAMPAFTKHASTAEIK
jgi:hypothetical protein